MFVFSSNLSTVDMRWQPQNIPLNIVYEDDEIIVINKPCDLVEYFVAANAYLLQEVHQCQFVRCQILFLSAYL